MSAKKIYGILLWMFSISAANWYLTPFWVVVSSQYIYSSRSRFSLIIQNLDTWLKIYKLAMYNFIQISSTFISCNIKRMYSLILKKCVKFLNAEPLLVTKYFNILYINILNILLFLLHLLNEQIWVLFPPLILGLDVTDFLFVFLLQVELQWGCVQYSVVSCCCWAKL